MRICSRDISWKKEAARDAAAALNAGLIGLLAFFCVKTACLAGSTTGSDNFASWVCAKIYNDIFRKSGERRGAAAFSRRLFAASDIKDPVGLAGKLAAGGTPLAAHIRDRLSPETRSAIGAAGSGAPTSDPDRLRAALAADLNRMVKEGGIYRKDRMEGSDIRMETKCLLVLRGIAPQGDFPEFAGEEIKDDENTRSLTAEDANRKILEDAFRDYISGILPGETIFLNAAPHVKLRYYMLAPSAWSFFIGALAGLAAVLVRRRREVLFSGPAAEAASRASGAEGVPAGGGTAAATGAVSKAGGFAAGGPAASAVSAPVTGSDVSIPVVSRSPIPSWLPPVLAAAGFFHAGYFWGTAAYIMAGYAGTGRWTRFISKVLAVVSAAFWGIGTELYWSGGWSKIYPDANHLLKNLFGIFGISF